MRFRLAVLKAAVKFAAKHLKYENHILRINTKYGDVVVSTEKPTIH
jgi:hypothetical protein